MCPFILDPLSDFILNYFAPLAYVEQQKFNIWQE